MPDYAGTSSPSTLLLPKSGVAPQVKGSLILIFPVGATAIYSQLSTPAPATRLSATAIYSSIGITPPTGGGQQSTEPPVEVVLQTVGQLYPR